MLSSFQKWHSICSPRPHNSRMWWCSKFLIWKKNKAAELLRYINKTDYPPTIIFLFDMLLLANSVSYWESRMLHMRLNLKANKSHDAGKQNYYINIISHWNKGTAVGNQKLVLSEQIWRRAPKVRQQSPTCHYNTPKSVATSVERGECVL